MKEKKREEQGEKNAGEVRRNEDNEKKVQGRKKRNVKGRGERRGIAKWPVVCTIRHSSPTFILSLFVGSFPSWADDPRRQFSSYRGEYAEARKGSRVYPLLPWLANYGYTFIRRWLYSIWLTRSRNTVESVIKACRRKLQTVFGGVQISSKWECIRADWRYYLGKYASCTFCLIIRNAMF